MMDTEDFVDAVYAVGLAGFAATLFLILVFGDGTLYVFLGMFVSFLVVSIVAMTVMEENTKEEQAHIRDLDEQVARMDAGIETDESGMTLEEAVAYLKQIRGGQ